MIANPPLRSNGIYSPPSPAAAIVASAHPTGANAVLARLHPDDLSRLLPLLTPCLLHAGQTLYQYGDTPTNVYFPKSGILSLVLTSQTGVDVEVGLIGREGLLGAAEVLAEHPMLRRAVVQVAGSGWRISASSLRETCSYNARLSRSLWRACHALDQQTAQCTLCNRLHSVDQRLSRWLLMCQDRMQSDTLELTHEVIGKMLGTRRVGVTLASGDLREAGLIESHRGLITILDRLGLEARSCECYSAICQSYTTIAAKN